MTTLYLPLKKKWFDMIKAGTKLEEYREIKDFYRSRIFDGWDHVKANTFYWYNTEFEKHPTFKYFDELVFTLAYPNKSSAGRHLNFKNPKIRIGEGRPEWGAEPGKQYFVITWNTEEGENK